MSFRTEYGNLSIKPTHLLQLARQPIRLENREKISKEERDGISFRADHVVLLSIMEGISYREADANDIEQLMQFGRQTFRDAFFIVCGYSEKDLASYFATDYSLERFKGWVNERNTFVYIAIELKSERIVGYLSVGGPSTLPHDGVNEKTGEINKLYIADDYKGKGVAQTLMSEGLKWFDREDCAFPGDVYISVWSENRRAQKFYSKYGAYKVAEYLYPVGSTLDKEEVWKIDRPLQIH